MSVILRMFNRGDKVLDPYPCQEVFVSLSFELSVVVGDDSIWEVVLGDKVFLGELFHLAGHNFLKWSCFYPLGEVFNNDK